MNASSTGRWCRSRSGRSARPILGCQVQTRLSNRHMERIAAVILNKGRVGHVAGTSIAGPLSVVELLKVQMLSSGTNRACCTYPFALIENRANTSLRRHVHVSGVPIAQRLRSRNEVSNLKSSWFKGLDDLSWR